MFRFTLVFSLLAILVATDGQIQSSTSSCAVPQETAYRTFKAYDSNDQPVDSERVPRGGYVQLQCADGYLFPDGSNASLSNCRPTSRGEWHPAPRSCQRICPLPESSNVDFTCKYKGREIGCDDSPLFSGTEIRPQCKFLHRISPDFIPNYTTIRCTDDGTWNRRLFTCDPVCGVPKHDPLIENGMVSTLGQFPWHVAIYLVPKGHRLICGGTLIAPNVVVSAAHCFYNESFEQPSTKPTDYALVVGKLTSNFSKVDHTAQERIPISEILFAEKSYKPKVTGYSADIALIVLQRPITISAYVLPACFRNHERVGFNPGPEVNGTLCGWGIDETGEPAATLKTTQLPFIHFNQCVDRLPGLTIDKFCAGSEKGPRARPGDSGGGLVFKDSNFFYIRGIVSTTQRFSTASIASFTDISYYQEWIDRIITEKSGNDSPMIVPTAAPVKTETTKKRPVGLSVPARTVTPKITLATGTTNGKTSATKGPSVPVQTEPTPAANSKFRGCYEVSARSSLLNDGVSSSSSHQTPDSCIDFCQKKNFPFAGVEKRECRCGRHVPSDLLKRSNSECNFACPGSNQETFKCGGKSKASVYSTGIQVSDMTPSRVYLGCVRDDNENSRVLSGSWNQFTSDNSPKKCHSTCFKAGFRYFGLTNEKECYCGDTIPAANDNRPDSECSSRCSGDTNEVCGGGWRLSLYATGSTGGT